jgi:hypothetical protein
VFLARGPEVVATGAPSRRCSARSSPAAHACSTPSEAGLVLTVRRPPAPGAAHRPARTAGHARRTERARLLLARGRAALRTALQRARPAGELLPALPPARLNDRPHAPGRARGRARLPTPVAREMQVLAGALEIELSDARRGPAACRTIHPALRPFFVDSSASDLAPAPLRCGEGPPGATNGPSLTRRHERAYVTGTCCPSTKLAITLLKGSESADGAPVK